MSMWKVRGISVSIWKGRGIIVSIWKVKGDQCEYMEGEGGLM